MLKRLDKSRSYPEQAETDRGALLEMLTAQTARADGLKREVSVLRLYGNTDCTRMADAVLEEDKPNE